MSEHELKIWPEPFAKVRDGRKTAEWRDLRDRDIRVGDTLVLWEYKPPTFSGGGISTRDGGYTGEAECVTVTDIETGFGIPDGFGMLSFRKGG